MEQSSNTNRRGLLAAAGMAVLGVLFGKKVFAEAKPSTLETDGEVLKQRVRQGHPSVEPLDSTIVWQRLDDNNGRAMTHEILSLIHEEKGKNSYPWTIYSHLTTNHEQGDACVLCSRLTKNGIGWSSGLHSEVFNHAKGVALGVNIEMTNYYNGPDLNMNIGLNIQACGGDCAYGIQVHGDRGTFRKAIGLNNPKGEVGLDIGGKYDVGINAQNNSIRVNEGTCIELDGAGKIRLRYLNGRIEFMNGDKVMGHLSMNGEDHEV